MPIEIQQPGLARLYGTAAAISKQQAEARRRQEQQARKEEQQAEFEYRTALRQQDMAIDLEMNQRAKLWEIDKMQLRSQMDFQREEQQRQRKLDSADNAIQQIDKEVLAGRMTEQEAYPLKLKCELDKLGVDTPTPLLPTGDEEEKFGVKPYWMRGQDAPEGTPERQLYEAKMAEQISGERRGVVPYYLDPAFIGNYPEAARQAQEAGGIFLSDEEFNALRKGPRVEAVPEPTVAGEEGERVRVVSPNGETGSILRSEITEYRAAGFEIIDDTLEGTPETVLPPAPEDIIKQLEAGEAKFYKPSLGTFATMSPLRALMEWRKAKKLRQGKK